MPTQVSLEQIELAELTVSVDDARLAADPYKLLVLLRTPLDARLADLIAKDAATLLKDGDRATASGLVRAALDQLKTLVRDGYNFINGIGRFAISEPQRLGLFTTYGWESGLIGQFTDARIESLANLAITATPTIADPAHRYPAALLTLITAQLAIVNANQPIATGGTVQGAIDARDIALELLILINARVRFYYCCVSDQTDQTPELTSIGRQARRNPGEAAASPRPDITGPVTFAAAALTLSLLALPDHATSLKAFRRAAGGQAELAGDSTTTTVSVVGTGPLTSGVTYEFWLVGHNAQGDGPESDHVTHVAV